MKKQPARKRPAKKVTPKKRPSKVKKAPATQPKPSTSNAEKVELRVLQKRIDAIQSMVLQHAREGAPLLQSLNEAEGALRGMVNQIAQEKGMDMTEWWFNTDILDFLRVPKKG